MTMCSVIKDRQELRHLTTESISEVRIVVAEFCVVLKSKLIVEWWKGFKRMENIVLKGKIGKSRKVYIYIYIHTHRRSMMKSA